MKGLVIGTAIFLQCFLMGACSSVKSSSCESSEQLVKMVSDSAAFKSFAMWKSMVEGSLQFEDLNLWIYESPQEVSGCDSVPYHMENPPKAAKRVYHLSAAKALANKKGVTEAQSEEEAVSSSDTTSLFSKDKSEVNTAEREPVAHRAASSMSRWATLLVVCLASLLVMRRLAKRSKKES